MAVTHSFVSPQPDGYNSNELRPSDWNAEHVISGGLVSDKVMLTPEGGIAIKLTNKTGSASVKGTAVAASTGVNSAFVVQAGEYDTIGFVYDNGVADGSECWVVVSGIAEALLKDGTAATRRYICYASTTDGRIEMSDYSGTPPLTTDNHFKEVGHCIRSNNAGTNVLALIVCHFN